MFAVMNNRGAQLDLYPTKKAAQKEADEINSQGEAIFAWVVEVSDNTKPEDMPGKGFLYM